MTDIIWTNTTVKLSQLKPWQGNPKTSTAKNAEQLKTSIDELGQFQDVAISPANGDGLHMVYDGHQRLNAWLHAYGMGYEISAKMSSRPLTEEEQRKIAIYSRQIGAWDWEILSAWDVPDLMDWGMDTDLLQDWGRDYAALANMLESEEEPPPEGDAEPQTNRSDELRELWGVELGQMWRLPSRVEGQEHRIICGDCTDSAVVDRVMGGDVVEMIVTDPPYNINKDDWDSIGDYVEWCSSWFLELPTVPTYVFTGSLHCGLWWQVSAPRAVYCWHKPNGQGNSPFRGTTKWEPILCWNPIQDKQTDFIEHNNEYGENVNAFHLTPKPTGLIEKIISKADFSILYEPFSGSGTTIIAAENLSRQCRAVEISPAYVAVALQRYQDAFDITPELMSE